MNQAPLRSEKMKSGLRLILMLLPLLALAACIGRTAYCEYRTLPAEGWRPADTLAFDVDRLQKDGCYAVEVLLRTSSLRPYPYRQLWLELRLQWDAPQTAAPDTLVCTLVTAKGKSLGTGVTQSQYAFVLDTLRFSSAAKGRILVRHIMSDESLPGITEVGLRLSHLP